MKEEHQLQALQQYPAKQILLNLLHHNCVNFLTIRI